MPARRILQLGDPMLRAVSIPVSGLHESEPIFQDLRDTLHDFRRTHGFGRGISAVQIGVPKRLIYIEFEAVAYRLQNPVFRFQSQAKFRMWDDCFSFPDLLVYLERSQSVQLEYEGANGIETLDVGGRFSELLQHEMDHLDGVLAVDRAIDKDSLCTRIEWERRYRSAAAV